MNFYLSIIIILFLFNLGLNLIKETLNLYNVSETVPKEFKRICDTKEYKKSQNYTKENTLLGIVKNIIYTPLTLIFIILGGFNYIDQLARSFNLNSILTGIIFTGTLILISIISNVPTSIIHTFYIEKKYEFNTTTIKTFIQDFFKLAFLYLIMGSITIASIVWFFENVGSLAWLYVWSFMIVFQIFIIVITPNIILPLFNTLKPIEEGELKESIKDYVIKNGFQIKGIFIADGSKRSLKANAYFTGIGRFKKIVLFDTLLNEFSIEEIISIIAHEVGHCKHKHLYKKLLLTIFTNGLMFYLFSLFINNQLLFEAFKMEELSIYGSITFFLYLYIPISTIVNFYSNYVSRKHELEADRFAVKTASGTNLIMALSKLSMKNLSNLNPHWLKVFMEYHHPPILKRLEAILKEIKRKTNGN